MESATFCCNSSFTGRGSQRDVVYLGWPMAPSYTSPNAGNGGWGGAVSANEYSCAHGAQKNFGDLTPYLTYVYTGKQYWKHSVIFKFLQMPITAVDNWIINGLNSVIYLSNLPNPQMCTGLIPKTLGPIGLVFSYTYSLKMHRPLSLFLEQSYSQIALLS